jgi:hypothetical protein
MGGTVYSVDCNNVVMDAEERAIGAELLGGDGEVNGLQQCIGRRSRLRLRRRSPGAEGEEADFFTKSWCRGGVSDCYDRSSPLKQTLVIM